jgi:phosphoglucomutase
VIYRELVREFGEPDYDCVAAPATSEQKKLALRSLPQNPSGELAAEAIESILTEAQSDGAPVRRRRHL